MLLKTLDGYDDPHRREVPGRGPPWRCGRGPAPGADELTLSDVSWEPPPVSARCGHQGACRCE